MTSSQPILRTAVRYTPQAPSPSVAPAPLDVCERRRDRLAAHAAPPRLPAPAGGPPQRAPQPMPLPSMPAALYDFAPGVLEGPRFRPVSAQELAQRAVALGGAALATALRGALVRHVGQLNLDLMAYHTQFATHYAQRQAQAPHTTAAQALASFALDMPGALASFDGINCGGLCLNLLNSVPEARGGFIIGSTTPKAFIEPGVPLPNHMAALVPFASPSDPADHGVVLLEPGFQIPEPIVVRPSNTRDNPVRYTHVGMQEAMAFFHEGDQIHCERQPLQGGWNARRVRDEALSFRTDEFVNWNEAVTNAMLAVHQKPRVIARDETGRIVAFATVDLADRRVKLMLNDQATSVPFAQVDQAGAWLAQHAPSGDVAAFTRTVRVPAASLIRRVHQLVTMEQAFAELREARFSAMAAQADPLAA